MYTVCGRSKNMQGVHIHTENDGQMTWSFEYASCTSAAAYIITLTMHNMDQTIVKAR